jgi:hypothetical protein
MQIDEIAATTADDLTLPADAWPGDAVPGRAMSRWRRSYQTVLFGLVSVLVIPPAAHADGAMDATAIEALAFGIAAKMDARVAEMLPRIDCLRCAPTSAVKVTCPSAGAGRRNRSRLTKARSNDRN